MTIHAHTLRAAPNVVSEALAVLLQAFRPPASAPSLSVLVVTIIFLFFSTIEHRCLIHLPRHSRLRDFQRSQRPLRERGNPRIAAAVIALRWPLFLL
eukprot:183384-Rhodomonas_salina.2